MGRLEIRVCGARNIGNIQKVGTPDPYVKVMVGEKKSKSRIKLKTRVVENSLNPVWNDLFKFQVADCDTTQVLFELWNDNVLVDDLMGSYGLSLNQLVRGVVQDFWVILQGTKISSAELHLRVLAVDFGRDPGPDDKVITSIEQDQLTMPSNQTFRPNKKDSPNQTPYPQAPQGLPQKVIFGPQPLQAAKPNMPSYNPNPLPPQPQPGYYGQPQAQQPMYSQQGYGAAPVYQQPQVYGAPPPFQQTQQQPYYQQGPPLAQPMFNPNPAYAQRPPQQYYAPPPPRPAGAQMAFGVPPDM